MLSVTRMCGCPDSQEVGSEAATLERVRNSSLVERPCAKNVPGLSMIPKLWIQWRMVGERSMNGEAVPEGTVERMEVRMPV